MQVRTKVRSNLRPDLDLDLWRSGGKSARRGQLTKREVGLDLTYEVVRRTSAAATVVNEKESGAKEDTQRRRRRAH